LARSKPGNWTFNFAGKQIGGVLGAFLVIAVVAIRLFIRYERVTDRQARREAGQAKPAVSSPVEESDPAPITEDLWSMPPLPELAPAIELEPGVTWREVRIQGQPGVPGHGGRLWVYLPAGPQAPKSLPCVLIAPAGTNLIVGNTLGDGSRAEHLPYARAGMAVVAYELDGGLDDFGNASAEQRASAIRAFLQAGAGLINAQVATEFAATRIPEVDPGRLYVAGHSSAATHALLVAENEPRVAACVAYAPVVDLAVDHSKEIQEAVAMMVPGGERFYTDFNPGRGDSKLACPLFLFYAEDDTRAGIREIREFGERLRQAGKSVTISTVKDGGHYIPMIEEGIARAIKWLRSLPPASGHP
jgi:dipeptidyl aminopeptidase/acylaminoacyl peptidase